MRSIALAAAILLVSGCATRTIATEAAKDVEPEFRYHAKLEDPDGSVQVVVKRNLSWGGAACRSGIFFHGPRIADLATGQRVKFRTQPGTYIMGAEANGICPGQMRQLRVTFLADEVRTFLVDYGVNGEYIFQEVAE